MMMISSMPEATASSTIYCIVGLSTIGNISFGCAFVAGRKRVPRPAAGIIAFFTSMMNLLCIHYERLMYMYFNFTKNSDSSKDLRQNNVIVCHSLYNNK